MADPGKGTETFHSSSGKGNISFITFERFTCPGVFNTYGESSGARYGLLPLLMMDGSDILIDIWLRLDISDPFAYLYFGCQMWGTIDIPVYRWKIRSPETPLNSLADGARYTRAFEWGLDQ